MATMNSTPPSHNKSVPYKALQDKALQATLSSAADDTQKSQKDQMDQPRVEESHAAESHAQKVASTTSSAATDTTHGHITASGTDLSATSDSQKKHWRYSFLGVSLSVTHGPDSRDDGSSHLNHLNSPSPQDERLSQSNDSPETPLLKETSNRNYKIIYKKQWFNKKNESTCLTITTPSPHFLQNLILQNLKKHFSPQNLPNSLSMLRIALIPLFIVLAPWDINILNKLAGIVFAIAAFTDFLDGYVARKWQVTSPSGAILDLLADKALLAAATVILSVRYPLYVPLLSLLIIREVVVMGLRHLSLERGYTIKAGGTGKAKTVLLSLAFTALTFGPLANLPIIAGGFICLFFGTVLSIKSALAYYSAFREHMTLNSAEATSSCTEPDTGEPSRVSSHKAAEQPSDPHQS